VVVGVDDGFYSIAHPVRAYHEVLRS
jgi:hypothetical protein